MEPFNSEDDQELVMIFFPTENVRRQRTAVFTEESPSPPEWEGRNSVFTDGSVSPIGWGEQPIEWGEHPNEWGEQPNESTTPCTVFSEVTLDQMQESLRLAQESLRLAQESFALAQEQVLSQNVSFDELLGSLHKLREETNNQCSLTVPNQQPNYSYIDNLLVALSKTN